MTEVPVLLVYGTTVFAGNPIKNSYDALAQACGATSIALPHCGIGNIWATYTAFATDINRHLGRGPDSLAAGEEPAILVGHSAAGPHIAIYLADHPGDRAILLASPMGGLDYLEPINAAIRFATTFCLPVVRSLIHGLFPLLEDLSPQSQFLAAVRSKVELYADRVVVIAAIHDHVVPWRSSCIPGAPMVLLVDAEEEYSHFLRVGDPSVMCLYAPGSGHLECLKQSVVAELIAHYVAELRSESAPVTPLRLVSA